MDEQDLKKTTSSIFDAILKDVSDEAVGDPLYDFILRHKEWFGDPETMNVMIIKKFINIIEECVKKSLHTDNYIIQSIFVNWHFFDNNITKLCEIMYGSMGCADKARFILKSYIKYKQTDQLPEFKDTYYIPKTGTPQKWMDFVESISSLQRGECMKFFTLYKELLSTAKL